MGPYQNQIRFDSRELVEKLGLKKLSSIYAATRRYFKKGVHYSVDFYDGENIYDLRKIINDFPWMLPWKDEGYSLKYIEEYLSNREMAKIFNINSRRVSTMRLKSKGTTTSLKLVKNFHYYKVSHSDALYNWGRIVTSFEVTEKQKESMKKVIEERGGKREFSLILAERWDRIRKVVGKRDIFDVFPKGVINTQKYIDVNHIDVPSSGDSILKYLSRIKEEIWKGTLINVDKEEDEKDGRKMVSLTIEYSL